MSWLVVPKQRRANAAATGPVSVGGELDRVAADIAVAQARAASKLASQTGALKAYLDFEKTTEATRSQGQRPVHNERFLGNTLKQVEALVTSLELVQRSPVSPCPTWLSLWL